MLLRWINTEQSDTSKRSLKQSVFFSPLSYADKDQLQAIYSAYLQPVLSASLKSHPVWGAVKNVHSLAGSMVAVYEQVCAQPLYLIASAFLSPQKTLILNAIACLKAAYFHVSTVS